MGGPFRVERSVSRAKARPSPPRSASPAKERAHMARRRGHPYIARPRGAGTAAELDARRAHGGPIAKQTKNAPRHSGMKPYARGAFSSIKPRRRKKRTRRREGVGTTASSPQARLGHPFIAETAGAHGCDPSAPRRRWKPGAGMRHGDVHADDALESQARNVRLRAPRETPADRYRRRAVKRKATAAAVTVAAMAG